MTLSIARAGLIAVLLSACTHLDAHVVDLGGRPIEVVHAGEGPTTVVFEAGLDDDWKNWDRVANAVAEDAAVFAYSRPGYGHSADATTPRDPAQIVAELRDLLASENVAPPYVLVGHSTGGAYMELFARSHPEETAGLVLVDGRPSDFLAECEAAALDVCGLPDAYVASVGGVIAAEYTAFPMTSEAMRAAGTFGAYPVRVLTATRNPGASDARMALWAEMQGAVADEAQDGEQILIDASHYLQVFRAREVTDAIRGVLR